MTDDLRERVGDRSLDELLDRIARRMEKLLLPWAIKDTVTTITIAEEAVREIGRTHALVPLEPTEAMIIAGDACDRPGAPWSGYATERADCIDHYKAMLAAAPPLTRTPGE